MANSVVLDQIIPLEAIEPRRQKTYIGQWAPSEDSDQPAQSRRLI